MTPDSLATCDAGQTAAVPESVGVSVNVAGLHVQAGERVLLENAAAEFSAGKITLVVGRSGAGKSVLLQILAGLTDGRERGIAHRGQVEFMAHRGDCTSKIARPRVGVVFQSFAIFDEMSPAANVQFARDHRRRSRGRTFRTESVQDVDREPQVEPNPAGAATAPARELLDELGVPRGVPCARLSGGQRQRLAIARTLAYDPDVILYDEPTSGLDPATAGNVAQLIRRTHERHPATSIVVTHDFESLCPIADRIYFLDSQQRTLREIPREEWSRLPEIFRAETSRCEAAAEANEKSPEPSTRSVDRASPPPARRITDNAIVRGVSDLFAGTSRVVEEISLFPLRITPWWRSPRWGIRFTLHYLWLVAGPSAWAYLAIAGAIVGFVTTYFTFRFLPYRSYTEPLLIDNLLASIGFSLYRILVPVLATILIAARSGAALASDVGGKQYGRQIDALRTFGASPHRYLLTGMLYATLIGSPCLEWISYAVASWTSLVVFTFTHPGFGPEYWRTHFHRELTADGGLAFAGFGWLLAKTLICGAGVALTSFFQGLRPKASTHDVSRSITATILWSTLWVLVVHFAFSFFEFERYESQGGREAATVQIESSRPSSRDLARREETLQPKPSMRAYERRLDGEFTTAADARVKLSQLHPSIDE